MDLMKKVFTVYFEFYGRKMKANVTADNPFEAQKIIEKKIKFIKTVPHPFNDSIDQINKMFK